MRRILPLFLVLTASLIGADFPTEITLTTGKTIRGTSFLRWQGDHTVVVKHAGGAAPLQLRYIAPASRAAIEAFRAAPHSPSGPVAVSEKTSAAEITTTGQVFIVTRGSGNYLFGGKRVLAFPQRDYQAFIDEIKWSGISRASSSTAINEKFFDVLDRWIHRAIGKTQTDGEGKFHLTTKEPCFVVCSGGRLVGDYQEINTWAVVPQDGHALLSNSNVLDYQTIFQD